MKDQPSSSATSPTPRRDFIIVGAGPAGARAAELLAGKGRSVLLLDPKVPWEKPCGGGLTAAALDNTPELRELSSDTQTIRELLVVAASGASVVIPLANPFETVSRERLSAWGLDRAITAGARFLRRSAKVVVRRADGWEIADGDGEIHACRWLIAADGATSRLRKLLAPDLRPELAPLRVAYPSRGMTRGRAVFQFLPRAEGYLWDFPRPGHHSVGIGVPPGTFSKTALDGAIEQYQLGETGSRAAASFCGAVIASSKWAAGTFDDLGGRDFALLGDAGGLADPATGEGIDYALRSASLAAAAFDPELGFRGYPDAVKAAFGAEIRRSRFLRDRLYHPALAERLVQRARQSPRGALMLMSLVDAVNEHRPLRRAVLRGLLGRIPTDHPARAVCECPEGAPEGDRSPGLVHPRALRTAGATRATANSHGGG